MLVIFFTGVISYPTSCTEDSQCSSGFYCEEGAHICRECLLCEDLKRESLLPRDACVKSVIDCGACLKGQVAGPQGTNIDSGGACAPPAAPPGGVLPPLAWAAIAASLLLIIIILCVFARTRTFKIINFASRTSVQSLRPAESAVAPPPPYNDFDTLPTVWRQADAPEAQRLMEMPALFEKPLPNEEMRPREVSASQAARVFNNPAYIRVPQNNSRSNTPEAPMLMQQIANSDEVSIEERSVVETSRNNNKKIDNDAKENDPETAAAGCNTVTSSLLTKTRADTESQDTNNNFCVPEESLPNRPPHRIVHAGATFVINVVENINNIQQRNDVTF